MGYFKDSEFQQHMLAFVCRDRNFLKRVGSLLEPKDFKPREGDGPEMYWIAQHALSFWRDYGEPIGGLLRTYMLDHCREKNLGQKTRDSVMDAVRRVQNDGKLVAVDALEQKILQYKARRAKFEAIQTLVRLQEKGTLTDEKFMEVCQDAMQTYNMGYSSFDYFGTLEERILRRNLNKANKWPVLFIDPLDAQVRNIRRKGLGLILALHKKGKSFLLEWIAQAYALQDFNVLFFSLEDPYDEVTDRMDAAFTDLAIRDLEEQPRRLRKRFAEAKDRVRGRIKIVDATEGGWTVARLTDAYDKERNRGFMADAVIIDYDDEIVPAQRKPERRFEFADIYRDLRQFGAKRDVYLWTAAQAKRSKEEKMILTAQDTAEDISKIRKVHFALGIGQGPEEMGENSRYLSVIAHKHDKQGVGCSIYTKFGKGIFYDRERTVKRMIERRHEKAEEDAA